jgi:uncharacterized protein (TIGR03067 family)
MKNQANDHRRDSRMSRRAFAADVALFVPGTGLIYQTRSLAKDHAGNSSSAPAVDGPSEQEKMQGKWKIVRCEFSGRNEDAAVGVEDTISGTKWLRPNRRTAEYQLKFDPTKNPKWVDLSAERLGDQTLKGIYSLDGDKLTICYAYDPDLPRPTEFKTEQGVPGYIYVLERVKKE